MTSPAVADAVRAAVCVAARLGVTGTDPAVLHDGANVIVHLSPAPAVAKVAVTTPLVRPDIAVWLQRELDLAMYLAAAGIPVMEPSPEVPATAHSGEGHVMSFWRYLETQEAQRPDEDTIGAMLHDLHSVLRSYPGAAPELAPLRDIPAYLAREDKQISAQDAAALGAAYERLTAELDLAWCRDTAQVLHGDAGAGNLTAVPGGWVWHDFEDTCTGPVAFDLAASTASQYLDGARILAAYGDPVDAAQLAICQQLRRLHLTVWYALYAERLPWCRPRSAELLALWRTA
ncbi:MAG: phosphotransferase [Streptosporangiaceae bacterium]